MPKKRGVKPKINTLASTLIVTVGELMSKYTDALVRQAVENKIPIKCVCGKRIADRDGKYIYIYCKACKRTHKYEIKE